MTRFEQELSGALGAFWKRNAEEQIAKMQTRADNNEIRTNAKGGAFWNSNGNYLPADCAETLSHTDFPFSLEETNRARKAQAEAFLEATGKPTKAQLPKREWRWRLPLAKAPRWSTPSSANRQGFEGNAPPGRAKGREICPIIASVLCPFYALGICCYMSRSTVS